MIMRRNIYMARCWVSYIKEKDIEEAYDSKR